MKYHGYIAFSTEVFDDNTGVTIEQMTRREYYGEVIRDSKSNENNNQIVDGFTLSNEFSVIADAFMREHFYKMRYLEWQGVKWKIKSATNDPDRPRIKIHVGEVYNDTNHDEGGDWYGPEQAANSTSET